MMRPILTGIDGNGDDLFIAPWQDSEVRNQPWFYRIINPAGQRFLTRMRVLDATDRAGFIVHTDQHCTARSVGIGHQCFQYALRRIKVALELQAFPSSRRSSS